MLFKGKTVKVMLEKELNEEYEKMNKIAGEENRRGIENSDTQRLLKSTNRAIDLLKQNPFAGINIPKNKIPKYYRDKFDVTNLFKINLVGAWRLVYTIRGTDIEILNLILDILDHDSYLKRFGYKK